ncbi:MULTISPECIES: HD domain-containing protein [Acinetobacter]|uniref:HD domain-containing protein n=1 Tax=Acinetobacter corruptisaponis TaxID=3045147 RepID=A0ABY8RZT4_9GAMM|nr:HD domain-containing protein [Acinetobacter sp. KCTC 92772]WHP04815.1 HD domain-containing protein [Acinetobacter sp. KCTC 92772]
MQIGRQAWMAQTSGDLSLKDRMALLSHSLLPVLKQSVKMYALAHCPKATVQGSLTLDDLCLPDSAEVKQALEKMQSCSSDALQNHCLRTWYYAIGFARMQGLKRDDELLAVSCLLHDLGMTEPHYQHHANCRCFAGQGAYAAKDWSIERGWTIPRADQLFDVISMHMNPHVSLDEGTEAHLLQQAASCDVIGSRGFEFAPQFRQQLFQHYPRLDFNQQMIEFTQQEAIHRPKSRTAMVVQSGFKQLVNLNPYLD